MPIGISSTTSAVNNAKMARDTKKRLGIWDEEDERAFSSELSAIGAAERGDLARYGAAYASAITDRNRYVLEDRRLQNQKDLQAQSQAGNAASGFLTAGYKGYQLGKEQGWWGNGLAKPGYSEGSVPNTTYGGPGAVPGTPAIGGTGTPAEAIHPFFTGGVDVSAPAIGNAPLSGSAAPVGTLAGEYGTGYTGAELLSTTIGEMGTVGQGIVAGAEAIGGATEAVTGVAAAGELTSGIAASMGAEAAASAATAGVTDAMVAAGTASMVPGIGWVVGAGIAAAAGIMMVLGGGKEGSIVCTELNRQGKLDDFIYHYDSLYRNKIDLETYLGYVMMFDPIVRLMKKSEALSNTVAFFALPTAREMAHRVEPRIKGSRFGRMILSIGQPICKAYYQMRRAFAWA